MPTKDSMIKTARITQETWRKMEAYMDREDVTFSGAIRKLVEEADIPKQRREFVDTKVLVDLCERRNIEPQTLIDGLVRELKRG